MHKIYNSYKLDPHALNPYSERTRVFANACHFNAIELVLAKVSLAPTKSSLQLADEIDVSLNPDLSNEEKIGFIKR